MASRFLDIVVELVVRIFDFFKGILSAIIHNLWSKFIEIRVSEKVIFINTAPAFFAVILPVAKFYIFEHYYYISNPLSVYLIAIIIIMFVSLYFKGILKFVIRLVINAYYLFWIIYIPVSEGLTKAEPHEITPGYYLNIAVPAVYIIASLFSAFFNSNE